MAKTLIGNVRGKDGRGISKIEKTATNGSIDTYTITYTDNTTYTFDIKNSNDGAIQDLIISSSNVESTTTASRTYTKGTYVSVNGTLKKVTSTIAQGSQFNSTNSKDTTIVNELKSGFAYSTSEADTGDTWVDGKAIYTKTIVYEGDGTTLSKSVSIDTGLATSGIDLVWIDAQNSFIHMSSRGTASGFMMPNYSSSWFGVSTTIQMTEDLKNYSIDISSNEHTSLGYCAITIRYLKK